MFPIGKPWGGIDVAIFVGKGGHHIFEDDSTGSTEMLWGSVWESSQQESFCSPCKLGIKPGCPIRSMGIHRGMNFWLHLVSQHPVLSPSVSPVPGPLGLANLQGGIDDPVDVGFHFPADDKPKGDNMWLARVVVDGPHLKVWTQFPGVDSEVDEAATSRGVIGTSERHIGGLGASTKPFKYRHQGEVATTCGAQLKSPTTSQGSLMLTTRAAMA